MFKKFTISIVMAAFLAVTAQAQVYRANLTQSGTNAPVATVFENTFSGEIVWTRQAQGFYKGTLAGAFPVNRTFILLGHLGSNLDFGHAFFYRGSSDVITILTRDVEIGVTAQMSDGILYQTSIEIRAYPN